MSDPWIPRPYTFRPIVRRHAAPLRVCELILPNREWNVPLVHSIFDDDDAKSILSIPLSRRLCADRLIWHYDITGVFTVKSAYKLSVAFLHGFVSTGSSILSHVMSLWKRIWSAKILGKVKVHIWRACKGILPTISQLLSRRVSLGNGCFFCNEESETIEHICRDCPFTHDFLQGFSEL